MQHITLDELRRLLSHIPDARWRTAVLVTFWHGLRASETLALTPRNFADGQITVRRLKGSRTTVHPLVRNSSVDLDETIGLERLLADAPRNQRLFPWTRDGFLKLMKRAGAKAGLPAQKRHPHALKHGCAMAGLAGGMKINELQRYIGHKNGANTLIYLAVNDEQASQAFCAAVGKESGGGR